MGILGKFGSEDRLGDVSPGKGFSMKNFRFEGENGLIQRAKTDKLAFAVLYKEYVDNVYAFVASRIGNIQDAEDITSKIWMKVLEKLDTLKSNEVAGFRSWLFTIARNFVIEHYRGKKVVENIDDYENNLEAELEKLEDLDLSKKFQKLLKLLPEKQSEVIVMRFFSDLSNKEIAEVLGISEKTVASNLSRGLEKLRDIYGKLEGKSEQ